MTYQRGRAPSAEAIAARLASEERAAIARLMPETRDGIRERSRTAVVGDEPPASVVAARIERSRLIPAALRRACAQHGVSAGVPCFGRAGQTGTGICGDRLARRST